MKGYRITVNGNVYEVQVEELNGASVQTAPAAQAATPVQTSAPAASASTPAPAVSSAPQSAEGTGVNAPMPGNILDIKVSVGDKVAANQVVAVLEAMKMENDIVTPVAGTVASVNVTKGQAVNSGDVLITVAE